MRARSAGLLVFASCLLGSTWVLAPSTAALGAPSAVSALIWLIAALGLGIAGLPWRGPNPSVGSTALLAGTLFVAPSALFLVAAQQGADGWPLLLITLQPLVLGVASSTWSLPMAIAPGAALVLLGGSVAWSPRKLPAIACASAAMLLQAWGWQLGSKLLRGLTRGAAVRSLALACCVVFAGMCGMSAVLDKAPRLAALEARDTGALLPLLAQALLGTALPWLLLWRVFAAGALTPTQIAGTQWLQLLVLLSESAYFARAHLGLLQVSAFAALGFSIASILRSRLEQPVLSVTLLGSPPQVLGDAKTKQNYTQEP